jgi:hypothetical protein
MYVWVLYGGDKSTYLEFRTREEFLKLEVFAMSLRCLVCEELRNQDAGGKLVQGLLPYGW